MTEKAVEKKAVGRTGAIALRIICIVLAVVLVGAIVIYTSIINGKDATIATKNSQLSAKDNMISSLTYQVTDLTNTLNLAKSTIWIDSQTISQPAGSYTYWNFTANYAGYISVNVQSSTTTKTYVLVYSSHGASYDNTTTVGTSGTAVFPALPSSIQARVGNTNLLNGATETVTITYHY